MIMARNLAGNVAGLLRAPRPALASSPAASASSSVLLIGKSNGIAAAGSVRHSHIGAEPLYVSPSVKFTVLPTPPPSKSLKKRPLPASLAKAKTIIVEGPQGKCSVPLYDCVRLDWDSSNVKGKGKADVQQGTERRKQAQDLASLQPPPATSEPQKLTISVNDPTHKQQRSMWGLTRAILNNALQGVQEGHTTIVRFVGVGYRGSVEDEPFAEEVELEEGKMGKPKRLNLRLGYSHPVIIPIPRGITCTMPQPNRVVIKGTDKEQVGAFAAGIRAWRPPEPYKVSITALSTIYTLQGD